MDIVHTRMDIRKVLALIQIRYPCLKYSVQCRLLLSVVQTVFILKRDPRALSKVRTMSNGGDVAVHLVLLAHVVLVLVVGRAQALRLGRAATPPAEQAAELPVAV